MNILLAQDSEYLWKVAEFYGIDFSSLKKANPHLENGNVVSMGEILIFPPNTGNNRNGGYASHVRDNFSYSAELEYKGVQQLISYSKSLNRQTDAITWTVVIVGGSAVIELAGAASIAGITIVVGVAAAAGLMYLTRNVNSALRMNSATNVGVMPPSTPNASISNSNSNSNVGGSIRVLMTEMAQAVKNIQSAIAVTLLHIGYLQNGKGPDCLPGSQCCER